jgi:hypothetical protein
MNRDARAIIIGGMTSNGLVLKIIDIKNDEIIVNQLAKPRAFSKRIRVDPAIKVIKNIINKNIIANISLPSIVFTDLINETISVILLAKSYVILITDPYRILPRLP